MSPNYDELTACGRPGCGHRLADHEIDERFTHRGGACGYGMTPKNPDGDCQAECMGFIAPGAADELPAVLAAEDAD